jgi:peptidoglycan/LPS O-acetylase OafA/YrhL
MLGGPSTPRHAADSVLPTRRLAHRPELDGLRGLAVVLVIGSHAQVPGFGVGAVAGVTLFFVLSGFLITSILIAERDRVGHVDLIAFYVRRALRLLPALYTLTILVLAGYLLGFWRNVPASAEGIVGMLLYVGNWTTAAGLSSGVLGHTWSLAVEEQFYILWPIALILGLRYGDRRTVAVVALAIAVAVLPWRLFIATTTTGWRTFLGTDTNADALLLGCAIAILQPRLSTVAGWAGIIGLIAVSELWHTSADTVPLFALAAMTSALAVASCPPVLAWRPLAYLGRISYGLYLVHYLLIWSGIPWPMVVLGTLAIASVSYRYLEQPFLRLKDRGFVRTRVDSSRPLRVLIAPARIPTS